MFELIDRSWRVVATAVAFAAFGLGGVALRLVVFPLLQIGVRDPVQRVKYSRLTIHHAFRAFIGLMCFLGILRYRIEGLERLGGRGQLVLANHPTLIDVVFLISLLPNADCVVKSSLARNPFTGGPVRVTNYICNDVGADLVEDCIASVKEGNSLVIFPEGTRTPVHGPMHLQRGAANIAIRGVCDITPVTIRCVPLSLTKGLPWWKVPHRRMQFTIRVHEAIAVSPFIERAGGELAIAARRLTEHLNTTSPRKAPTMQALEQEITALLIEALGLEDIRPEDIDPQAALFVDGLGLDSIDALELGLALQKRYGVTLSGDSQETRRHFSSVRALAAFVQSSKTNEAST